ncbi:MAG: lysoplasmalogenase [Planctomycetes bacterium]|nr:lysoplasmalogenase [Planctomycetota bacterium]
MLPPPFFALLYAAATAGTLVGPAPIRSACKCLLMPLLLASFRLGSGAGAGRFAVLVSAALAFSWLGDVALLGDGDGAFAIGLAGFLVAHVAYAAAFLTHVRGGPTRQPLTAWTLAAGVIACGGLVGTTVVSRTPPSLTVPVALYATAISAMGVAAALRLRGTSAASFATVFLGAELFIVSDALLAANRFVAPLPAARVAVMSTYCLGQFLIVAGCLRHLRDAGRGG